VELITIDAVVLDAEGRPVPGLTRDDFVVREEGRPRTIESFEAIVLEPELDVVETGRPVPPPVVVTNTTPDRGSGRAFAVLVDDLSITRPETPVVTDAVRDFLQGSLSDGDEVILGTSSGSAWWSARIPEGRDDLLDVLGRVEGSYVDSTQTDFMTEYEAFWINNYEVGGQAPLGTSSMVAPGSVRERVIRRWLNRMLCGYENYGAVGNCWPLIKSTATALDAARRQRDRLTLGAVERAFEALAPVHGRTSLLLFSPGFVQDTDLPLGRVRRASRETNTAVYFIDARGLVTDGGLSWANVAEQFGDPREDNRMRFEQVNLTSAGSQDLADDTGGFSVRNTNDLAGGAQRIADESRVFYLLGFRASKEASSDEWRKLEVEVGNPDLTVRARRGYTLRSIPSDREPPPRRLPVKDDDAPEPTPDVVAALDSVHLLPGLPLRAMVYVLEPRADGATHVLVVAELDARQLALRTEGDHRVADLEVGVTATHRDTGRGFLHSEDIVVKVKEGEPLGWRGFVREFELTTGIHQARVVIRDRSTGKLGAVTQRFEVPFPGDLRLSTPILTDRLVPGSGESRPRPALAAHRTFLPEGGLYCQFEVFGATPDPRTGAPRVAAGLEIKMRSGRLVQSAEATPINPDGEGRLVRLVGMGLDGMAEGPYEFVLSVHDQVTGARLEERQPFTITRAAP
jgi:VWFA-related protein